jgi:hypothetical protein
MKNRFVCIEMPNLRRFSQIFSRERKIIVTCIVTDQLIDHERLDWMPFDHLYTSQMSLKDVSPFLSENMINRMDIWFTARTVTWATALLNESF